MPPTFADLGVPDALVRALDERGIIEPFPIQTATLPDALAGRDVCGRAPTGSGKTLAFGLPLAARVTNAAPKRPKALVLVPTRELAAQVRDELEDLLTPVGRTVHAFYGGVGFGPQLAALRSGVDVVVACPGRLADLVQRGAVRLDRVDIVVLDEADRMADMGFLPEVKRLLDQVMPQRQTLLFSATLDGDVDTLIRRYQRNPARHGVDRDDDGPVNRHVLWRAERDERVALTAEVVGVHWPAIVFTRTKHGADRLAKQLGRFDVAAEAIHGNRSQSQRERALRSFSSGRAQVLVATDVAARGIHVDDVACVLHYDAPPDHKDFVHRSGRTGRAGAEGLVVTLTPRADDKAVQKMMRKAGIDVVIERPDPASLSASGAGAGTVRPRPAPAPRSEEMPRRVREDGSAGRNGGGRRRPSRPGGPRGHRDDRRGDDRRHGGSGGPRSEGGGRDAKRGDGPRGDAGPRSEAPRSDRGAARDAARGRAASRRNGSGGGRRSGRPSGQGRGAGSR